MKTGSKKWIAFFMVIVMLAALLAACGKNNAQAKEATALETQRISFEETTEARKVEQAPGVSQKDVIETSGDQLIAVNYPVVEANATISSELENFANDKIETFRQEASSMGAADEGSGLYTLTLTYKPYVVGTGLIGFKFTEDSYTLKTEAHNNVETFLYDVATGSALDLDDVFDAGQDYLTPLAETVRDYLSRNAVVQGAMNEELLRSGTQPSAQNFSRFVITPDNQITFFFNEGQVAPVEVGPVEVCVPLSAMEGMLNTENKSMLYGRDVQETVTPNADQAEGTGAEEGGEPAAAKSDLPQLNKEGNYIPAKSIDGIDPINDKVVALTFDDGPGPYTEDLLNILKENEASATFFLIGENINNYPELVQRAYDEGHELGTHSWDHTDLKTISFDSVMSDQYGKTNDAIEAIIGKRALIDRPPYGSMSEELAEEIGREQIIWSVDTNDWRAENKDPDIVYANAVDSGDFQDGAVILMHDIHQTTVQAVDRIVKELKERGYKLVTITQLMQIAEARGNEVDYKFFNAHKTEGTAEATPTGDVTYDADAYDAAAEGQDATTEEPQDEATEEPQDAAAEDGQDEAA